MLELRLCRNDFRYRGFSGIKNEFISGNLMRFPEVYLSVAIEGFFKNESGEEILTYFMVHSDSVEIEENGTYKKVPKRELWLK